MNVEEACDYFLKEGFSLIPVRPGSKVPAVKWKKVEIAPKDHILRWIAQGFNIAVLSGSRSDNLVVIDCDTQEVYDKLFVSSVEKETMVVRTGRRPDGTRGYHVYFKTSYPVKTTHYAQKGLKLDIPGERGIVVLPPSRHPSGVNYEFATIPPPSIKRWSGDFEYEIAELIKEKLGFTLDYSLINAKQLLNGVRHGYRDVAAIQLATYFRILGLTQDETLEKLRDWDKRNLGEDGITPDPLGDEFLRIKVKSAFAPEQPYHYRFTDLPKREKETDKGGLKESCGKDLGNIIFEQTVGKKYVVYDKATSEISIADTIEEYRPFSEDYLLWKSVGEPEAYGSEQQLFDEVRQYVWDHLDLQMGYDILAAWILASWMPERWRAVPYLFFYGPPGSGKTWALEILASIGLRPFIAYNASLAAIFRVLDEYHLTLFLDETEVYMQEHRMEMLSLLNNGYRRGGKALRTVETYKDGVKDSKPRPFDVFGFKSLTGTKELIDTLMSRCIIFNMALATRPIKAEIDEGRAEGLRRKLLAYRFKMLSQKETEKPEIGLKGRLKELFEPLIIVVPISAKQVIINEALSIQQQLIEEFEASPEAMVFRAVIEVHEKSPFETRITIDEVAEIVNRDLDYTENMDNAAVGRITSKLGFKRCLKNRRRAIFWNEELALRHASRYYTEWTAKKEGQRVL